MDWLKKDGVKQRLILHIQPGAKKTEVAGEHGDALKIRLAAPPVEGKANQKLIVWLADFFAVPQRQVEIKSGETSRRKIVEILDSRVAAETLLNQCASDRRPAA